MKESNGIVDLLTASLKVLLITMVAAAVLLLAFTGIAYSAEDPNGMVGALSLAPLFISSLIGGISSARIFGEGAIAGIISGLITAAIVFILSFIPVESGANRSVGVTLVLYAAIVLSGLIGGVIGRKRGKKRPQYNKAARRR